MRGVVRSQRAFACPRRAFAHPGHAFAHPGRAFVGSRGASEDPADPAITGAAGSPFSELVPTGFATVGFATAGFATTGAATAGATTGFATTGFATTGAAASAEVITPSVAMLCRSSFMTRKARQSDGTRRSPSPPPSAPPPPAFGGPSMARAYADFTPPAP
jgi:hypothetical protein